MENTRKMANPTMLTIGMWRVVLDIQPEWGDEYATGIMYFQHIADESGNMDNPGEVGEYVMDLGDLDIYAQTGEIRVKPENSDITDFNDMLRNVLMAEETGLTFPKADIVAHLRKIAAYFSYPLTVGEPDIQDKAAYCGDCGADYREECTCPERW